MSQVGSKKISSKRRVPQGVFWVGAAILMVLIAMGVAAEYLARNAEPILRRRVIATLEDRFRSPVELDALHLSVLKGLQVSGSGLRILSLGEPGSRPADDAPMLAVNSFEFHTGLRQLLAPTMHIDLLRVDGMQLHIPPKQQRGPLFRPGKAKGLGQPHTGLEIGRIVCSDLTLTIETDKPGKLPLIFAIHDVTLHNVGEGKPFAFEASLVNPKPVGEIRSNGHFGPWQSDDPRETPLNGSYSFTHADLGTIKGISGTLSSTGSFDGTLGEIGVAGTTETPDFALDVSEHPVELRTVFNATVDGTTGDTRLNSVHATLRHTELQVSGAVMRASDGQGHLIDLAVSSERARVEDVLTLGVRTTPPLLSGALTLHARLKIPPGHVSVSRKMRVEGTFAVAGASFSNPRWQETVDKLSARASGNPEQAKTADAQRVTSAMSGSFALADAVLDMPKLNFQIPGAQVNVTGKYGLDGKTFDFDGTVRTKATASQMLTGWKSLLAMPLDKLLKKDGAGLQVPITIRGTEADPKLGLDLGKLGSQITHKSPSQPAPGHNP